MPARHRRAAFDAIRARARARAEQRVRDASRWIEMLRLVSRSSRAAETG